MKHFVYVSILYGLLCSGIAIAVEIKESALDGKVRIYNRIINDEDALLGQTVGLCLSADGKHSVAEVVVFDGILHGLLIDGKLDVCKNIRPPARLALGENFWDNRYFLAYTFSNRNRGFCTSFWLENEEVLTIKGNVNIMDFWVEKLPNGTVVPMIISMVQDITLETEETIQYIGKSSKYKLSADQEYWYRTFSSKGGSPLVRLQTDENGRQSLYSVNHQKEIIRDCDAIVGISFSADEKIVYFTTIMNGEKVHKEWVGGKETVSQKSEEVKQFVNRDIKTITENQEVYIYFGEKNFGPFVHANSLIYSQNLEHGSMIVQCAKDSKYYILTEEGLSKGYDDIVKILGGSLQTNDWHTFAQKDGKWYRLDVQWKD